MSGFSGACYRSVELGNLADFRNGVNYSKKNFGNGVRIINVKDFQDRTFAQFDELDEIDPRGVVRKEHLLDEGDFLFVRSNGNRALIGRSLYIRKLPHSPVTHSAFTIRLRLRSPEAEPRFFMYLFRAPLIRGHLSAHGGGTNISNLNQEILARLRVPLPPLPTQRRIAEILGTYDDLIENITRRIAILEEMAKRLYEEWFVRFRFPGHEQVRMVDSPLGLIPDGWHLSPLGDLAKHTIGGTWGDSDPSPGTIPARVVRGTDIPAIQGGFYDQVPLRFVKQNALPQRLLRDGDLIIEVSGGSKDQPVGRCLLVTRSMLSAFAEPVTLASFCRLLRFDRARVQPEFVFAQLRHAYRSRRIVRYQTQSTGLSNLRFNQLLEEELVLHSCQEVSYPSGRHLAAASKLIETSRRMIRNLRTQRDLLLPKLISGEIDVSEAPGAEEVAAA